MPIKPFINYAPDEYILCDIDPKIKSFQDVTEYKQAEKLDIVK